MSNLTPEEIAALKAQGYHFRATAQGEVQFTPDEEAEWAARAEAPPPRRELPKSTVYGRLKVMGKVPALLEIFAAQPQIAYEWNMPGWPNIFADDEQLLAALGAIGCTAEQIATITAPA